MLRTIVEVLPIVLAVVAIISCGSRFGSTRHISTRRLMMLCMVSATIMMVAQISWWSYWTLGQEMIQIRYNSALWDVFNSLSMAAFIYASKRRTHGS